MQNTIENTDIIDAEFEDLADTMGDSDALAVIESVSMDTVPQFAISLDEAHQRFADLRRFCREELKNGEDYGVIPGCGNKPALFKPGAEKLNALFGLAPLVQTLHRDVDIRNGYVEYEIKVILIHKATGRVEAEGVGSCSNQETKYVKQSAANVANTVLKMAKKRALVDATLSATRVSGLFTQDIEDMPRGAFQDRSAPRAAPRAQSNHSTPNYAHHEPTNSTGGQSGDGITDAQQRAISAIASRVFGRAAKEDEIARLCPAGIETLSKRDASNLIEKLRAMLTPEDSQ